MIFSFVECVVQARCLSPAIHQLCSVDALNKIAEVFTGGISLPPEGV